MIEQTILDRWGQVSSRRVAAMVGLGALSLSGVAAAFGHALPDHLVDVFTTVTIASLGLATTDHFAPRKDKADDLPAA